MEFENSFSVTAPIDEVYAALMDIERVAPCLPGAQVLERASEVDYKVGIKVKLGPVTMSYRGDVHIAERNPDTHTASMRVSAKEARGQGTATAEVSIALAEEDGATRATIHTNLRLSGKAAAMGQGVIADVSARLVDQFAANLAKLFAGEPAAATPGGGAPAAGATPTATASGSPAAAAATVAAPNGGPAAPPSRDQEAEGLDVLSLAGGMLADRTRDPRVFGAIVAVAVLVGYLLGRGSR